MSLPSTSIAAITCNLMLGGATTFLLNLAKGLRGSAASMRVIGVTDRNEMASDFAEAGTPVEMTELSRLIYEDRLAWVYERLAAAAPQAVLACLGSESFEMLRMAPPGVARIGVIQSHDPLPYTMASRYAPWLDAIVGVSQEIGRTLREMPAFQKTRVETIQYGIEFDAAAMRPPSAAGAPLRVLYLGRLIEVQKRISRVIELIRRLEKKQANVVFTIAGSGPEEAMMREELRDCRSVTFLGQTPNREVPALLCRHDVFLLLSDFEGLPLSLLEAMGYGVVPVVSDLQSGIGEVVSKDAGVRTPVGDVEAAVAAIRELEAQRDKLHSLGARAQEIARESYSAQTMARRYLGLIEDLRGKQPASQWSPSAPIPVPLGVSPLVFHKATRPLRRMIKRLKS